MIYIAIYIKDCPCAIQYDCCECLDYKLPNISEYSHYGNISISDVTINATLMDSFSVTNNTKNITS